MYSRELDGETLTIRASGWIYQNLFVLYDDETGSLWYELPGTDYLTCIAGPSFAKVLPSLASSYVPWETWLIQNPATKALPSRN